MIHHTALVSPAASLETDVEIGPYSVIHDNVVIRSGSRIGSHCILGEPVADAVVLAPLELGPGSVVRSHSVLYAGSRFGPGLETGHHVTLREGLSVGANLRVGSLSDLQGDSDIGDYVRLHSNVHIGKFSTIGNFVWIFPFTVLTNDPHPPSDGPIIGVTVEEYAVIATMCCVAPGVRVGARSLVAASSMVTRDVEPDSVVRGVPARDVGPASAIVLRDGTGRPAYPWTGHFSRGYPEHIVAEWTKNGL